jgi:hypothetical protein
MVSFVQFPNPFDMDKFQAHSSLILIEIYVHHSPLESAFKHILFSV